MNLEKLTDQNSESSSGGRAWCPTSGIRLLCCSVDEITRLGLFHWYKRQVPVYPDDYGHWVFNFHQIQPDSRAYIEVLPAE